MRLDRPYEEAEVPRLVRGALGKHDLNQTGDELTWTLALTLSQAPTLVSAARSRGRGGSLSNAAGHCPTRRDTNSLLGANVD